MVGVTPSIAPASVCTANGFKPRAPLAWSLAFDVAFWCHADAHPAAHRCSLAGPGVRRAMQQQLAVGLLLGAGLAAGGWVRVYLTNGNALNATAISISLFLIVLCSVVAGTGTCDARVGLATVACGLGWLLAV